MADNDDLVLQALTRMCEILQSTQVSIDAALKVSALQNDTIKIMTENIASLKGDIVALERKIYLGFDA